MKRFKRAHPSQGPWTPFERGVIPRSEIGQTQHAFHLSEAEVAHLCQAEIWLNNRYQVEIKRIPSSQGDGLGLIWLSIKRRDRQPIHDWRELQRAKNELVGPEYEAVELFPAESRLCDSANQYHLWVIDDPTFRFPFGFQERLVIEHPGGKAVQRPFEKRPIP